jgi:hypothetical protein
VLRVNALILKIAMIPPEAAYAKRAGFSEFPEAIDVFGRPYE